MTIIRQRLPESVYDQVFVWVLGLLDDKGLLRGKSLAIDATTLEANAAMKSIVRRDTGESWKEYLQGLAKAEGIVNPTEEDLRRPDRTRADKKVSNQVWQSPSDPDSRIAKMKDGRTHLAYKAEHAVDVVTEAIVAATVTFADKSDPQSAPDTLSLAGANLVLAGSQEEIEEAVMDKGYHDNALLAELKQSGVRTCIPERRQKSRRWTDKPEKHQAAFRANRRRVRGKKSRQLNRWRSERCERTFAHVCETGGGRRAWVRGQVNVSKMHTLKCAAHNLGLLLRKVWGFCKPRNAAAAGAGCFFGLWMFFALTALVALMDTKPIWLWLSGAAVIARSIAVDRLGDSVYKEMLEKSPFFNGLLGIARFTHHDLRHLFATTCIEAGVDIPTVSRWLGHKDGGALAMKVYGHLRDQHSANMAQRVSFDTAPKDKILPLRQAQAELRQ